MMQPTLSSKSTEAGQRARWLASLRLDIEERRARSVLARNERSGPIQVQRPFPQPHGGVHLYILHPPGGMVGGDRLDIQIRTGPQSRALLTTPSATKFYRVEEQTSPSRKQLVFSAMQAVFLNGYRKRRLYFEAQCRTWRLTWILLRVNAL